MKRFFANPNLAALQSVCLAANEDREARASVWAAVALALDAVPSAEAEALCPTLRSMIPTYSPAYKTLTNRVSAAMRAIRCGVPLHDKDGAVFGQSAIEKQCQIAEDEAYEEEMRKLRRRG